MNKFDLSMCHEVRIESLHVGDIFFEDTCSEVWEVTGHSYDDGFSCEMTDVKLIGYLDGSPENSKQKYLDKIGKKDAFAQIQVLKIQKSKE